MITKKYITPLYGTEFTILLYNDNDDFGEYFKGHTAVTNLIAGTDGSVFYIGDDLYLALSIDKGKPSPGIIAHESKHLVNNIFIHISCKLSRWNDEPEAYLLKWVVDEVHQFLEESV